MKKHEYWLDEAEWIDDPILEVGFHIDSAMRIYTSERGPGDLRPDSRLIPLTVPDLPMSGNSVLSIDALQKPEELLRYYHDVVINLSDQEGVMKAHHRLNFWISLQIHQGDNLLLSFSETGTAQQLFTKLDRLESGEDRNLYECHDGYSNDDYTEVRVVGDRVYLWSMEWLGDVLEGDFSLKIMWSYCCLRSDLQKQIPEVRDRVTKLLTLFRTELGADYWGGQV